MSERILVREKITSRNDEIAAENRARLDAAGIFALNLMASPGAGKTALIEQTVPRLLERFPIGVIDGDLATTLDADRAARAGAVSVQINAASCHLDAPMVSGGLDRLELDTLDLLLIENVGNLVCPASWELGTHASVLIASIPEGDDKPYKYPTMYRGVDVLVVNKIDLLPHLDFDMDRFRQGVEALNEEVITFPLSCATGEGIEPWIAWIIEQLDTRS